MHCLRVKQRNLLQFDLCWASPLVRVQEKFGDKLRQIRANAGVSQEKLAELAGLHRTYISGVERGLRNISLLNIEKIADALDVEMADLMPSRASLRSKK